MWIKIINTYIYYAPFYVQNNIKSMNRMKRIYLDILLTDVVTWFWFRSYNGCFI